MLFVSEDEPAFFSWLGVTGTLRERPIWQHFEQSQASVLREANSSSPMSIKTSLPPVDRGRWVTQMLKGEPYKSGFDPEEIANDLKHVGLELIEDLDEWKMSERYRRAGANSLQPAASLHIALALVTSA
jgi:hypothetical protein